MIDDSLEGKCVIWLQAIQNTRYVLIEKNNDVKYLERDYEFNLEENLIEIVKEINEAKKTTL